MTFTGTAKRIDIGTGIWVLETGREKLTLYGTVPRDLEGKKVTVEGSYVENLGVGMLGGRALQITGIKEQ